MRLIIIGFFFISVIGCKEKPTYNPFDDQFNVSVKQLVKDGCHQVSAQCGYFNFIQNEGKGNVYYQIFIEEPKVVVGKGFEYIVDTIELLNKERFFEQLDSINLKPVNLVDLDLYLSEYNFAAIIQEGEKIGIVDEYFGDTINLKIRSNLEGENMVVRRISYFVGRN